MLETNSSYLLGFTELVPNILYYLIVIISLIGLLLNSLSLFIFIFSNNMNTKFLLYLKFFLINSFTVTINYLVAFAMYVSAISNNKNQKLISHFLSVNNYEYIFYYSYVFLPLWTISYTCGNILDIMIVYERILMYLPQVKFMRNLKPRLTFIVTVVLACLINLPACFSRDIIMTTVNSKRNVTNSTGRSFFYKTINFLGYGMF